MQPRELLMLSMYILVQAPVLTGLSKNQTESLTTNNKRGRRTAFYRIKKHLQHDFYRINSIKNENHSPIKGFYMKDMKAVVVFTGKDLNIMRTEGGSGYWHARTDRLNDADYLIAVRNRRETWAVKDLEHGTAFLIAKITGCFKSPDYDDRNVITFDEYAEIHTPKAWKMLTDGQRYPVAYLSAQEAFLRIGVTPEQLEWKKFHPSSPSVPNTVIPGLAEEKTEKLSLNEAIERAKKDISNATGIDSSAITISIKI